MPDRLLTVKEAAEYLRLTPGASTPTATGARSLEPWGFGVGRKVLYRPADINRFLDDRLAETHAAQPP